MRRPSPSPLLPITLALLAAVALLPASAHARNWVTPLPSTAPAAPANAAVRPDPKFTPGDTLEVTLADIQVRGYPATVRDVPVAVKRQGYAAVGIARWNKDEYGRRTEFLTDAVLLEEVAQKDVDHLPRRPFREGQTPGFTAYR